MNEYEIWKKIFEEADEFEMEELLNKVMKDDDAIDYVFNKVIQFKNKPKYTFNINIDLDETMKDYPLDILAKEISKDIIKCINKYI